ncbi:GNAT family N-acetyltransferase [Clostridium hydrogeniformans]|uniref:GNAT family N-acetyltransferase n=1 Tax=Clostridium hydrogeniformans TaxID=349933 RepID=UPI0004863A77|nr:GNAT family N-acetyltransferase [Clostridium hydrogeniformans]
MISFIKGDKNLIKDLSKFIGNINKHPEKNIGYLGEETIEIEESLREDFTEEDMEKAFILAYENNKLAGTLGIDIDEEKGVGEALGPFIEGNNYKGMEKRLFIEINKILPLSIKRINMYFNKENIMCKDLSGMLLGEHLQDIYYMSLSKEDFKIMDNGKERELEKEDYDDFIKLHESFFKDSYYSGKDIINRLNENKKIFVLKDEVLRGYICVEYKEKFKEGIVEFIGVKEELRGKGIGKKLLSLGVDWLFSKKNLENIRLTTSIDNKAFYLYKSLGFNIEKTLSYYKINRENIKLLKE